MNRDEKVRTVVDVPLTFEEKVACLEFVEAELKREDLPIENWCIYSVARERLKADLENVN